jgi:hypothetical protein
LFEKDGRTGNACIFEREWCHQRTPPRGTARQGPWRRLHVVSIIGQFTTSVSVPNHWNHCRRLQHLAGPPLPDHMGCSNELQNVGWSTTYVDSWNFVPKILESSSWSYPSLIINGHQSLVGCLQVLCARSYGEGKHC